MILDYKHVGKELTRVDAFEKITGMAKFVADIEVPGMLYGKFLRSPHAHARILKIDTRTTPTEQRSEVLGI